MRRCGLSDFDRLFHDCTFEYKDDTESRRKSLYVERIGDDVSYDSYIIARYPDTIMFNGRSGGKMVIESVEYVEYDNTTSDTLVVFYCGYRGTILSSIAMVAIS